MYLTFKANSYNASLRVGNSVENFVNRLLKLLLRFAIVAIKPILASKSLVNKFRCKLCKTFRERAMRQNSNERQRNILKCKPYTKDSTDVQTDPTHP